MVAPRSKFADEIESSPLRHAITVQKVTGGEQTILLGRSKVGNPEFAAALKQSLKLHALLAPDQETGRFRLAAHLVSLEQPWIGFDMTVRSTVRYQLWNKTNGAKVYEKTFRTKYTEEYSINEVISEGATIRLKRANEGAMRENIQHFIDDLFVKMRGKPIASAVN